MVHKIFKTLLAAVVATMTFCVEADTETINGIEWIYSVENGKASLESGGCLDPAIPKSTSGAITIPSTLGGYPVTIIGICAFRDCSSLTSVTIPNSVTSIGIGAFDGCSSLTSVTIPDSVTSIGSVAFLGCKGLADSNGFIIIRGVLHGYCGEGGVLLIPDSVTNIGDCAFCDCSSLTSVTIPNSVTSIGERVFSECGELTIYTDKGNLYRLCKMLENTGANVKEVIEQKANGHEAEEQKPYGFLCGFVLGCASAFVIFGGLFFWIVRRKNKREGAFDKRGRE